MRVLLVSDNVLASVDPLIFTFLEAPVQWAYRDSSCERQELQALFAEIDPANAGLRSSVDYSADAPDVVIVSFSQNAAEMMMHVIPALRERYAEAHIICIGDNNLPLGAQAIVNGAHDYVDMRWLLSWQRHLADRLRLWKEVAALKVKAAVDESKIGLK